MTKEYLTIEEAAEKMQVSFSTAYKLVKSGKIKSYRPSPRKVLIAPADISVYMESCAYQAPKITA